MCRLVRPRQYALNSGALQAFRVESPNQLAGAVEQALAHPGPALVDMATDPDALSLPPNITWEMLLGFSASATRTS
ncbi:hypothetical protein [Corynebacterium cystitidis]|uniref:hypothetical protein n=1 Tax=Corynebacterium cystitidis TaxID=35757 RepID=UPI00211EDC1B|nr:hypothetical protein [Corynebacterium cystitidis]